MLFCFKGDQFAAESIGGLDFKFDLIAFGADVHVDIVDDEGDITAHFETTDVFQDQFSFISNIFVVQEGGDDGAVVEGNTEDISFDVDFLL